MTGIEEARRLFEAAGLVVPAIPTELAARLQERGKWCFSTRELEVSPYDLDHYVRECEELLSDYAILSHAGYGVNSYAIQYFLVSGPLRMFLHLGWGGVYMDSVATTSKIRECFSLADEIVPAALTQGKLGDGDQLLIVGTDFYDSYWSSLKGDELRKRAAATGPVEACAEALRWLTSLPSNGAPR